ncbi:MAG: T9SS type A sorting domain-containing protein, partial [Calditrichales bacterium]
AYRLISLPLDATNKKPANVLEDNLGPYNNTQWRFFELRSDQTYSEHPNTADMNPGKAFWLIVKSADKIIDSGPGKTIPTNTSYSISLAAGWNLIGDPFNFNIPVSNLSLQNDSTLDIRAYNGSWSTFQGSITPYMGYAVYSETATSLLIDPDLSTLPKLPTKNTLAKKNEQDWSIAIEAQCDLALDSDTKAMTHVNAAQKFDSFDRPEPPVIGDFVSVYFPHPEWGKMSSSYCIDARPSLVDGEIWEFAVRANIKENVTLSFKGIENIPDGFEVWVADRDLKIFKNLGKNATYDAGMATVQPKNMLLIVGKPDFIAEKLDGFEMIPKTYVLFQNFPNPFNPTTTIRYGLPKEETVSLRIYNLLGQEVRVLMDREHKMAGYHTAQWDGKNQSGSQVASGMYIYHLQAGSYTNVKKMLLVR